MLQGKGYNENFFSKFQTIITEGLIHAWNTLMYGLNGTTPTAIQVDAAGSVRVTGSADSYVLAYTGSVLDTVTRASDSKVITLTYTGDNLTGVSDWT